MYFFVLYVNSIIFSTVSKAMSLSEIGKALVWSYVADSDGSERCGCRTSGRIPRNSYDPATEILSAESKHSHYQLEKLKEKWGDIYADRSISLPDWYPGELGALPLPVPIEPKSSQ